MKLWVVRHSFGLAPAYSSDAEKIKKLEKGESFECEIKQPRNLKFHRKFFAMLKLAFDNQEQFETLEDLKAYVICKAGFYRQVPTPKGVMILPKSIAFNSMDEGEFAEVYDACLNVVSDLLGVDNLTLQEELNEFL